MCIPSVPIIPAMESAVTIQPSREFYIGKIGTAGGQRVQILDHRDICGVVKLKVRAKAASEGCWIEAAFVSNIRSYEHPAVEILEAISKALEGDSDVQKSPFAALYKSGLDRAVSAIQNPEKGGI